MNQPVRGDRVAGWMGVEGGETAGGDNSRKLKIKNKLQIRSRMD